MAELGAFHLFAGLALVAAFFLFAEARTPLAASVAFAVLGLAVAGAVAELDAGFLAAVRWMLSLGAALALFVTWVMVSGMGAEPFGAPSPLRVLGKLLGVLALAAWLGLLFMSLDAAPPTTDAGAARAGAADLGRWLFGPGASAAHLLGLLLLVALVGAVVLGKRRLD